LLGDIATTGLDAEIKEEIARKRLYEVSEKYNMGIEDVEVEFDSTLPYNVLGRTTKHRYSGSDPKVVVGDSFLEANEAEQLRTMAHEGFHVKQFRDEETNWLQNEFGISQDFSREVDKAWKYGDVSDIEGITELVVDNLMPFGSSGYPYEKKKKEKELEAKGIDVESELVEDIENEIYGIIDEYKQVWNSFEQGGLYFEEGSIGDFSYTAVSLGEYEPEEKINEYLGEILTEDYEEMLEEDYPSDGLAV
jgi:hypothetical protein